MAATPEGTAPALENDRLARGQLEQAGSALGPTGRRETTEDGDAAPRGALCIYCRRALHNSSGDSEVGYLRSTITCDHGEFVHAACMLDRAERLACGHTVVPQPSVVCLSEWTARARPPHPGELVEDLPRPRPWGRWAAVGGALQFAELLEEDGTRLVPASYVTTGSHHTFEHMVRTHGRSPTSSFLLCSLYSDALGLPREAFFDLPRSREWQEAATDYRERFAAHAIRPRDVLIRLPNWRIYIGP